MSKSRKSVHESTGKKNWRSTHQYSCKPTIVQLRKVDFKNSEGENMLMCLDYIKFLRLTKRQGGKKCEWQEHTEEALLYYYYCT